MSVRVLRPVVYAVGLLAALSLLGCVGHRAYNLAPEERTRSFVVSGETGEPGEVEGSGETFDLAVIEFDDHGQFWDEGQLRAAVELIDRRNAEHPEGVAVIAIVHGWKNNADFSRRHGTLVDFRRSLGRIVSGFREERSSGNPPRHLIGVYLAWRGDTTGLPVARELTFWDRLDAAERVASLNMQEALFSIMHATKRSAESRCFIYGHSMGGLVVARALRPSMTTLVLQDASEGFAAPADLVVLLNPALDAYSASRFIDFLKRYRVRTELRATETGEPRAGDRVGGPLIVSITSTADNATGVAYPAGRRVQTLGRAFRDDHEPGTPSQATLVNTAEGHVGYLVSHDAVVEDGRVVLRAVPGAYNDTPFWVIRVPREIVPDHSTLSRPEFAELMDLIQAEADLYNTRTQAWIFADPPLERSP